MLELKLTADKKERIDKIIEQWEKDIEEQMDKLPESDGKTLDGPRTRKYVELEHKYKAMIQAIIDE